MFFSVVLFLFTLISSLTWAVCHISSLEKSMLERNILENVLFSLIAQCQLKSLFLWALQLSLELEHLFISKTGSFCLVRCPLHYVCVFVGITETKTWMHVFINTIENLEAQVAFLEALSL